MNTVRRPSLFWPILLIGLGTFLLLDKLNLLPAGTWAALAQLWPVLFILLGLDMLIGRRSTGGVLVTLLVGALVVTVALTWAALRVNASPSTEPQTVKQSFWGAQQATVEIGFDVGRLSLKAVEASDSLEYLLEGRIVNLPGQSFNQDYAVTDGVGNFRLSQEQDTFLMPFLAARQPDQESDWDIRLSPRIPIALDVHTGVGEAKMELSNLQLQTLTLSTGVGSTEVTFPERGALSASVATGIGEVVLNIPEDLPTRITLQSGVTGVDFPTRFRQDGNVYTTTGFTPSGDYLELELKAGIGAVTIR